MSGQRLSWRRLDTLWKNSKSSPQSHFMACAGDYKGKALEEYTDIEAGINLGLDVSLPPIRTIVRSQLILLEQLSDSALLSTRWTTMGGRNLVPLTARKMRWFWFIPLRDIMRTGRF